MDEEQIIKECYNCGELAEVEFGLCEHCTEQENHLKFEDLEEDKIDTKAKDILWYEKFEAARDCNA